MADARRELQRGGYGEALRPGPGCMHAFGLFPQEYFIRKRKKLRTCTRRGCRSVRTGEMGFDLRHHGFQDFDSVEVEVEVEVEVPM